MNRIGILGGSFNPIHLGHLHIAEKAATALSWDKVLFIPNAQSPLKTDGNQVSAMHRLAMLKSCLKGKDHYEVLDWEIKREGLSYTIDTVRALLEEYPDDKLYFIIGADSLATLHKWKDIDELLHSIEFVVLPRPDTPLEQLQSNINLADPWPQKLCEALLEVEGIAISSTQVRKAVAEHKSLKGLVPASVEAYIKANNLYNEVPE